MRINLANLTRALVLTTLAGGCGLISSDLTTIKFALPERTYNFDTAMTGWNLPAASLPMISCTEPTACCTLATLASIDCAMVICDASSGTCALTATVEIPPQAIDLKANVPELASFSKQSVIDVTVSKITYDLTQDATRPLNVALPPVELFVAAQGATSTSDPSAKKFGTVPGTAAGMSVMGGAVALDAAGQAAFVGFAHNFGTPFVFLGRTTVVVPGGTPLPMGAATVTIKGQLSAKAGL
jgi:hypothetical protein